MSALLPDLSLTGIALWAPGFDDLARLAAGDRLPDPLIKAPKAEILPARLRRRCSLLTRMSAEVVAKASAQAAIDTSLATVVLASVYGEIRTTGQLLVMMAEEPGSPLSPTRFHNSVHNTPIGYLSIACSNHQGSTAISAGPRTLAMAMLEAATVIAAGEGPVVVVIVEEPLPEGLALDGGTYDALAVAFVVESARDAGIRVRLGRSASADPLPEIPENIVGNPCANAVAVATALVAGATSIPLEPAAHSPGDRWRLEVVDQSTGKVGQ